jgi:P27 family predicted phage terminase small subunit
MSRGGVRHIKSAAEKKAAGTSRKDRDGSRMETVLPTVSDVPPPPPHFTGRYVEKWNEVAGKVFRAQILSELDTDFLQVYVENWFVAADAMEHITQNGAVLWIESAGGSKPIRNPNSIVYAEAVKVIKAIGEKFGLSSRDRQSIKVQEKPKTSLILEMMKGRQAKKVV